MSTSYFINDRIYLRAIEPEDLDIMYAMENDPQTWDITNSRCLIRAMHCDNTSKIPNATCLPTASCG